MEYIPFTNIDNLCLYSNTNYYNFIDGIHIKEIYSVGDDIICVFYLNVFKKTFPNNKYIDVLYTSKLTINNLIYNTKLRYITINEKSDELFVYYYVSSE